MLNKEINLNEAPLYKEDKCLNLKTIKENYRAKNVSTFSYTFSHSILYRYSTFYINIYTTHFGRVCF